MTHEQALLLTDELGLSVPTEQLVELLQHAPWPVLIALCGLRNAKHLLERMPGWEHSGQRLG
jgi:hypothetical protein